MGHYLKSIDPIATKRYVENLHLLDLGMSDDWYAKRKNDKIEDDMTTGAHHLITAISFATSSSAQVSTQDVS